MTTLRRYLLLLLIAVLPLQGWAAAARMGSLPTHPANPVSHATATEHCESGDMTPGKPAQHADCLDCGQCSICHPPLLGMAFSGAPHRLAAPFSVERLSPSQPPQPLFRPPIAD
ncbi:MAG TPA: hypothetical protein VLC08_14310 [Chitinolyticbacter sp.]|nr:hypothetical protein [Chitinolyticbacter sp.]